MGNDQHRMTPYACSQMNRRIEEFIYKIRSNSALIKKNTCIKSYYFGGSKLFKFLYRAFKIRTELHNFD